MVYVSLQSAFCTVQTEMQGNSDIERLRITFTANVNLSQATKFFLNLCFTVHQFY